MYESHNTLYSRYGAFALKASYQRNLFQSQLIVVGTLLFGFAVALIWPQDREIIIKDPIKMFTRDSVSAHPEPPPTVIKCSFEPRPELPENTRFGIPEPVPGDAESDVVIPTTDEIFSIVGTGDSMATAGMVIDTDASDVLDGPGVFVKREVDPALLDDVEAVYPQLAQRAGIEGTVVLYGRVSEEGLIIEVRTAKSSGSASLDEAASVALKKTRWKSGVQNGRPVKCWITKTYKFEID